MLKKYSDFRNKINEEVGLQNMTKIAKSYDKCMIYHHMDLDGVTSGIAMKEYLKRYGIETVDTHIIQYGGIEYAVKNTPMNIMPVLVDFAHAKPFFVIATDHHDKQAGAENITATHFAKTRSNVETISGVISPSDSFTSTDIKLIQTVDSADFLKYNITPEDVQNAIFSYKREKSADKNRFLMGLVVNRLLLALKTKRISVKSLDGKRNHINKNLLECLVLDSNASLYSIFLNLRHYINNAISLEWDMRQRSHNVPKKLSTPEEITQNLMNYIEKRKRYVVDEESGDLVENKDIQYDEKYKIIRQYGIGSVFKTGSYDRYVVFKNFPEANFVCTIFSMGLIQVSCNPFKEKKLKEINLGAIAKEVLGKFKYQLSNINIAIGDIKRISEDEIKKMKDRYGHDYEGVGFKMSDLHNFYKNSIIYLPNRKKGDLKTKEKLDLTDKNNPDVILLSQWMDKPYTEWPRNIKEEINWLKIPVWDIIIEGSGGHPSITNIQGLNYMGTRRDLLKILFKTEEYTDVMKLIADEFIRILKSKIDALESGQAVTYAEDDFKLKSSVVVESFEYFIKDEELKSVSKEEFIQYGMNTNFEPKRDDERGFKFEIEDNKIIGYYEKFKNI
jgi:hypothetical protein